MAKIHVGAVVACALLQGAACLPAQAQQADPASGGSVATYQFDNQVKLMSEQRTRGISDSLMRPSAKWSTQFVHASGLVALLEVAGVSKKQFVNGDGLGVTLAGGYRFGNPDGWHAGVGLATERFPGARFMAPHSIDLETGTPTDVRTTNYNSDFAVMELGYGIVEGRVLYVVSKTYRGADTGGVCGQILRFSIDPTAALQCYARGEQDSRGTVLADLNTQLPLLPSLLPSTTLRLHAGYQKLANFREGNFADYQIGITHRRWGLYWNLDWLTTNTNAHQLYWVQDGERIRKTDGDALVFSIGYTF
ncbi:TorF family putative porin [Xanthomonas euvesicatoria]|uniref:TorF family putative porin n=1 Tax=Xanthomonas euvesicatoria TaxID=456327 RepID=UPI001C4505C4|nr:TorF family putative porin [Xanthomonas euvesicatoria]MBV6851004.1 hypothetical protein [Xanthomonas campestris pv. heliotropii]